MAGNYIHDDVKEIITNADASQELLGWTDEQREVLNHLLQLAWNRGYKASTEQARHTPTPKEVEREAWRQELAQLNRKSLRCGLSVQEFDRQVELMKLLGRLIQTQS